MSPDIPIGLVLGSRDLLMEAPYKIPTPSSVFSLPFLISFIHSFIVTHRMQQ